MSLISGEIIDPSKALTTVIVLAVIQVRNNLIIFQFNYGIHQY